MTASTPSLQAAGSFRKRTAPSTGWNGCRGFWSGNWQHPSISTNIISISINTHQYPSMSISSNILIPIIIYWTPRDVRSQNKYPDYGYWWLVAQKNWEAAPIHHHPTAPQWGQLGLESPRSQSLKTGSSWAAKTWDVRGTRVTFMFHWGMQQPMPQTPRSPRQSKFKKLNLAKRY